MRQMFKGKRVLALLIAAGVLAATIGAVLFLRGNGEGAFRWLTSSGVVGVVGWVIKFGGDIRKETSQLRAEQEHEVRQREEVQRRQDANMVRMGEIIGTYERRIAALSADLNTAEARADRLEQRWRDALALTEQQRETITKLQTENQAQAQAIRAMQAEIERLKVVDAAQQEIIRSLQARIDNLTAQQIVTTQSIDAQHARNEAQQARNDTQEVRNDAQQARNDQTDSR